MAPPRRIRILSFDGENTISSGVSSALETLRDIMRRVSYDESKGASGEGLDDEALPCNYFDLIVGSGDGGWVAAMLSRLSMSVSETIDEYRKIHSSIHHYGHALTPEEKAVKFETMLKNLIKTHTKDPEAPLQIPQSELKCNTALLAMNPQNLAFPRVFRSYLAREDRVQNCPIWQAIRAATAATDVFGPCTIGDQTYISASKARHCNPIETALNEAKAAFPNIEIFCVVSLGSGHPGHIGLQGFDSTSNPTTALEKLVQDAEQASQHVQSGLNSKGKPQVYFRFNVEQGLQNLSGNAYSDAQTHTISYCRKMSLEIDRAVERLCDMKCGFSYEDPQSDLTLINSEPKWNRFLVASDHLVGIWRDHLQVHTNGEPMRDRRGVFHISRVRSPLDSGHFWGHYKVFEVDSEGPIWVPSLPSAVFTRVESEPKWSRFLVTSDHLIGLLQGYLQVHDGGGPVVDERGVFDVRRVRSPLDNGQLHGSYKIFEVDSEGPIWVSSMPNVVFTRVDSGPKWHRFFVASDHLVGIWLHYLQVHGNGEPLRDDRGVFHISRVRSPLDNGHKDGNYKTFEVDSEGPIWVPSLPQAIFTRVDS